jgi:hypothetical protein
LFPLSSSSRVSFPFPILSLSLFAVSGTGQVGQVPQVGQYIPRYLNTHTQVHT